MTRSVKLKEQPVAPNAAVAAPSKKSAATAAKAAAVAASDAASAGMRKEAGAVSGAKAATVASATKKTAAGTGRKPAASAVTKAAPAPSAPRKAESAKPVKPLKAGKAAKPLKALKSDKASKAGAAELATTEASAAPVKKPATTRPGAPKAKLNKRSAETIAKILETTGEIILQSGAEWISILGVCEKAGISRGTFYRYFSSQDELLDAFSRHQRDQFHAALLMATAGIDDPDKRFQAVLGFVDHFLETSRARRLLLVAPEYAMRWLQRIFNDSVHRFQDILAISFDSWEERRGITLDRELISELIVRFILSDVLVPAGVGRPDLMRRIERLIVMLLSGRVARR